MPGFDISLAFFGAALFLAAAPGPDNIFVLTESALFGARAGIITTFGLISGLCVHTLAVVIGIAALLQATPWAFNLLKCAGAAYLCWLAWLSFRAGATLTRTGEQNFPGYGALYRRGVIMNVSNPKVALFFLAFLPQFCMPDSGPPALQIIFFGILFMAAALMVFILIALLGGRLAAWFNKSPKIQIAMHRISGLVFLGLAVMLAFMQSGAPVNKRM